MMKLVVVGIAAGVVAAFAVLAVFRLLDMAASPAVVGGVAGAVAGAVVAAVVGQRRRE